jgi:psiF repeat
MKLVGFHMPRIWGCLIAAAIVATPLPAAMAQSTPPAATASPDGAKPSRIKLTVAKLKEMKAKWGANKPKMKACRQEVKAKGLAGDDRWFYMQDCMTKS